MRKGESRSGGNLDRLEYEKKFCSEYVINIPVNCDENLMKM